MVIKTTTFTLNRKDFFWILVRSQLKTRWWMPVMLAVMAVVYTLLFIFQKRPPDPNDAVFYLFVLFVPFFYFFRFRAFAASPNVIPWLSPRRYVIDDAGVTVIPDEQESEVIPWQNINRVRSVKGFVVLDLSVTQFLAIPDNAFENTGDRETVLRMNKKPY